MYASKLEARRAEELDLLLLAGVIASVKPQVKFPFIINGLRVCTYICDFLVTYPDGTVVIEDTKGFETSEFKIKRKLLKAIYNKDIINPYEQKAKGNSKRSKG